MTEQRKQLARRWRSHGMSEGGWALAAATGSAMFPMPMLTVEVTVEGCGLLVPPTLVKGMEGFCGEAIEVEAIDSLAVVVC